METIDQYESIVDLDERIIVKLDKFYQGNMFIDDGMIAICKFDMYLVEIDISDKDKIDLSILFDLFEDFFSEVYDQLIEFYTPEDLISIAEDIIQSISHKSVMRHCDQYRKELQSDQEEGKQSIEILNSLLRDSQLKPEEIPQPTINCLYETTRSVFEYKNRTYPNPHYRFTIAKRIIEFMKSGLDCVVKIELTNSNSKIKFLVLDNIEQGDVIRAEKRKLFDNGDSSIRINFPPIIFLNLCDKDFRNHLFSISLKEDYVVFSIFDEYN